MLAEARHLRLAPAAQRLLAALAALAAATALAAVAAPVAEARACSPVVNPYAGTRYEGTDLRRIRTTGVGCAAAREVVRGAHRRALGMTPPRSGVRRFGWRGWRVVGNLRGSTDRYTATRGRSRITWIF